jgi:hypothetical protein
MRSRSIFVGAVAVIGTVLVANAALAALLPRSGPTGNSATIAYYTTVTKHFNDQPFDVVASTGAFWLGYSSPTAFSLSWDTPHRSASFQEPAKETEISAVSHQKILWEEITWTYACLAGHVCVSTLTPLRFFLEKHAAYWAILDGRNDTAACWNSATGSTAWIKKDFSSIGAMPWYVGSSPFATSPNYKPMLKSGHTVRSHRRTSTTTGHP